MNVQTISIPFDEELLPIRKLNTSKLSCIYEHGRLRYLKYGETEVIRMIYFAVRDKDWETVPYTIENEIIETNENSFLISYTSFHHLNDITYRTDVIIKAQDHTVAFQAKGEALSFFKRNRIGICVLHPIDEYSGRDVIVSRPDGTEHHSQFPELISPLQLFKDIKKMRCKIRDNITADLVFDGDIFETEDQRNWADRSYKTYSTPLDIPLPVTVRKGDLVEQKIELQLTGEEAKKKSSIPTEKKIHFPKIGYCCKNDEQLSGEDISLLRQIPFDHYRVEIYLFDAGWEEKLSKRLEETKKLDTKLELILFFNDDFAIQIETFIGTIKETNSFVGSVLALHIHHAVTPVNLLEMMYEKIKTEYPFILVGYGTDGLFADLNRNRPTGRHFDFVSFSLSPQVHASDTRSLLENLERQKDLIQTAQSFAYGKNIHISPITLKMRSSRISDIGHPYDYDARQHRAFGAMWTLFSIKNLADADRLTFYQVKGYRGILNPEKSAPDQTPLYRMLKAIKTFNPKWIIDAGGNENFLSDKIALENNEGNRLEFIFDVKKFFP